MSTAAPQATGLPDEALSPGAAQAAANTGIVQLVTAIGSGVALSAVQILIFIMLKNKLVRIL